MDIKKKNPDSILFFRLGDFYEMFFEDALIASRELEITLTKRDAGFSEKAPMCGVPYHVANTYISRLIHKGYKVAICDQMEDPKLTKGLVKRSVTQIITPGTFTDNDFLKQDENNYLMVVWLENYTISLSYVDYSTGELYTTEKTFIEADSMYTFLRDELYRVMPSEILINSFQPNILKKYINLSQFYITTIDKKEINIEDVSSYYSQDFLHNLNELIRNQSISNLQSMFHLLCYLSETQKSRLEHICQVHYYDNIHFLILDENSKQNLELVKGLNTHNKSGSLLDILDCCKTAMGSRCLKKWVESPLISINQISERQNIISAFKEDLILLDDVRSILQKVYDIERLSVKMSNNTISPREIDSLKHTIQASEDLKSLFSSHENLYISQLGEKIGSLKNIYEKIDAVLIDSPPALIEENKIIVTGYSAELDELFSLSEEGRNWIVDFEAKEREKTGIKNLKVKYNKILGYFIEITKSNLSLVPDSYIRKQTLVSNERFFSIELKEMESKILGAKENALALQLKIYNQLKDFLLDHLFSIQKLAKVLAEYDVLCSLADVARKNNYIRPLLNTDGIIEIREGRHPIVEQYFKEEFFIPNDTLLDLEKNMIHIITGPNMAGKSTYMRQVAIICIMAHIGCFVPASFANISILDRIFTRIGASDNLAKGESTFMVEMKEVSNIVTNASKNSLLILDEVGRGTSTYDGLSIAWAIIEYIATDIRAKTLFATHYHELVVLAEDYDVVDNLTIAVEKKDDDMVFLRKIIKGFSNNSYGIDVAKLAGINEKIITRSNEILHTLETAEPKKNQKVNRAKEQVVQKSIFDVKKDHLIHKLCAIDVNRLSPIEALNLLNQIVQEAKEV